jgi:hypothetical protein
VNQKLENIPAVLPPALDTEETEFNARNEFLTKSAIEAEDFAAAEIAEDESEAEFTGDWDERDALDEEAQAKISRRAKRRKSLMFLTMFGAACCVLFLFISWTFGFALFAAPSRVKVDRNQKPNGTLTATEASSDEKLKTALAIVAGDTGNNQNSPVISDISVNPDSGARDNLSLSPVDPANEKSNAGGSGNMIVLPNESSNIQTNPAQNQPRNSQTATPVYATQNSPQVDLRGVNQNFQPNAQETSSRRTDKSDGTPSARSIFFGRVANQTNSVAVNSNQIVSNVSLRSSAIEQESANLPPFGTLLPVRFLGAVFTLQSSGGLIRMELSRAVRSGGFSYPAGTVLVGRLRGSETNRAFISVFGAIDPKSGKLVKFEGDVLGTDGASGVVGQRKSVKSWGTRFLNALRETSGQAVNVLSSRGGRAGTIVLGGTGGVQDEVSSVIRGNTGNDSFVVVKAGTPSYVLITDLPGEQSDDSNEKIAETQNQLAGLNLSETEIAELLTTSDANKIRAAVLKMSPKERELAVKAIVEAEK